MSQSSSNVMKVPLRGKSTPRKSHFKCTIVGDSGCGKTSLLRSHCTKMTFPYTTKQEGLRRTASQYPGKYADTHSRFLSFLYFMSDAYRVYNQLCLPVTVRRIVKGSEHSATITDCDITDMERRVSSYKNSDAIIICFSLVNQTSFKNVKDIWLKEVRNICPNTPVVLVGTKSDLVHSTDIKKKDIVTAKQINKFLTKNFVHEYCEASALTKDGLDVVFGEIFEAAWIGPVRYVLRMKTVKPSARLQLIFLPCLFRRTKQVS